MIRLLVPFALFAAAPAFAAGDLAQVQAHLRGLTTMTADFTQTDARGKVLTGTLTLKQPGRIRFQYQPGVPLLIVGDGHALTMIDYQVRQVSRWPVGNSPLALLLDPAKDVSAYARVVPGATPGRVLVAGRDPKHPEFGTITLAFAPNPAAPAGLMLTGWTVLDAQGNQSSVALAGQRFGAKVDDRTFQWRDPRPQTHGR